MRWVSELEWREGGAGWVGLALARQMDSAQPNREQRLPQTLGLRGHETEQMPQLHSHCPQRQEPAWQWSHMELRPDRWKPTGDRQAESCGRNTGRLNHRGHKD